MDDPFRFEFGVPRATDGSLVEGQIAYIDTYGNLVTSIGSPSWQTLLQAAGGDLTEMVVEINRVIVPVVTTFGDVPEDDACAYLGSAGRLEVAVNRGSAARRFEAVLGTPVKLKRLV